MLYAEETTVAGIKVGGGGGGGVRLGTGGAHFDARVGRVQGVPRWREVHIRQGSHPLESEAHPSLRMSSSESL